MQSVDEWRAVFFIAAAIYLIGAIIYSSFASGEKQPWAETQQVYQGHIPDTSGDHETTMQHDDLR